VFIGIFVLLATKPAYISAHMCVFVETALQVGEGERQRGRFPIATKPAYISAHM
jgi:hypothetical protein